eukprot:TRINITY_DN25093_c0_g1_i2.p1 TRINITY_DN25093_c0_g1~~TRINITY_DN25093_c0_g1_i2.p1  ORF type:complete len:1251 (+),score=243.21 TRINITY_DN25093_c0_g1_i2:84-3836(+)
MRAGAAAAWCCCTAAAAGAQYVELDTGGQCSPNYAPTDNASECDHAVKALNLHNGQPLGPATPEDSDALMVRAPHGCYSHLRGNNQIYFNVGTQALDDCSRAAGFLCICRMLPPTVSPSQGPTGGPTPSPVRITRAPLNPSQGPTQSPEPLPTARPVVPPTAAPVVTAAPSASPSPSPSTPPSPDPTQPPSASPTGAPLRPSAAPTLLPTARTAAPTGVPTGVPTAAPTAPPSRPPVLHPTASPSPVPSPTPSRPPLAPPTWAPSYPPSASPTPRPVVSPTRPPSAAPSRPPEHLSGPPTAAPSAAPSAPPAVRPSSTPTGAPTAAPRSAPSPTPAAPSAPPTSPPAGAPIVARVSPTTIPTEAPSAGMQTAAPTAAATGGPVTAPRGRPTAGPSPRTGPPSGAPSGSPSRSRPLQVEWVTPADVASEAMAEQGVVVTVVALNGSALAWEALVQNPLSCITLRTSEPGLHRGMAWALRERAELALRVLEANSSAAVIRIGPIPGYHADFPETLTISLLPAASPSGEMDAADSGAFEVNAVATLQGSGGPLSSAAAVGAFVSLSPSGAGAAQQLVLLLDMRCSADQDRDTVPRSMHPLGMAVGGSNCAGADLLNMLLVVLFCAAHFAAAALVFKFCKNFFLLPADWRPLRNTLNAQGLARYPSAGLFAFTFFYQGNARCAWVLMLDGSWRVGVAVVVAVALCLVPLWAHRIVRQRVPELARYRADDLPRSGTIAYIAGSGEWVSRTRTECFAHRFKMQVSTFREERAWCASIDFVVMMLTGAASAIPAATYTGCGLVRLFLALVTVAQLVAEVRLAPHARPRDNHLDYGRLVLTALGLLLAAAAFFTNETAGALATASKFTLLVAVVCIFAKLILDGAAELWIFCNKRRTRLQRLEWEEEEERFSEDVATAEAEQLGNLSWVELCKDLATAPTTAGGASVESSVDAAKHPSVDTLDFAEGRQMTYPSLLRDLTGTAGLLQGRKDSAATFGTDCAAATPALEMREPNRTVSTVAPELTAAEEGTVDGEHAGDELGLLGTVAQGQCSYVPISDVPSPRSTDTPLGPHPPAEDDNLVFLSESPRRPSSFRNLRAASRRLRPAGPPAAAVRRQSVSQAADGASSPLHRERMQFAQVIISGKAAAVRCAGRGAGVATPRMQQGSPTKDKPPDAPLAVESPSRRRASAAGSMRVSPRSPPRSSSLLPDDVAESTPQSEPREDNGKALSMPGALRSSFRRANTRHVIPSAATAERSKV